MPSMRRCCLRAIAWVAVVTAALSPTRTLVAQSNGALFLLAPFGARAVGQGEAVVADSSLGTEGLWWNAASLARLTKKDLAIHHSQTVFATNDMLAYAIPSRVLGTIAASAYIVNYGDQPVTRGDGEVSFGTSTNRNYLLALAYATPMGKRLSAGLTYKFVMLRFQCSGECGTVPVLSGNTQALDLGVQYRVNSSVPLTLGASLRNLGPALQIKDREQADPLPRVLQIGAKARIPVQAFIESGATLDISSDLLCYTASCGGDAGVSAIGARTMGLGVVVGYREQVFLRGGYKFQSGEGGGPSIGFGLERGGLGLDIARRFDALSSQLGDAPTYVSLRVRF